MIFGFFFLSEKLIIFVQAKSSQGLMIFFERRVHKAVYLIIFFELKVHKLTRPYDLPYYFFSSKFFFERKVHKAIFWGFFLERKVHKAIM